MLLVLLVEGGQLVVRTDARNAVHLLRVHQGRARDSREPVRLARSETVRVLVRASRMVSWVET